MNKIFKTTYLLISIAFLLYLSLPAPDFPSALDNVIRSYEPADVESVFRRGYYTDMEREEVMQHYVNEFSTSPFYSIGLPTYRLNYPPEESQIIIRDQTRSTFLEEISHPFRESLYVNGFKPTRSNEVIIIDDYRWNQKIIVKMVPSSLVHRMIAGVLTVIVGWRLIIEYKNEITGATKHFIAFKRSINEQKNE